MKYLILFLFPLFLLFSSNKNEKVYYVALNGNDNWSGTVSKPSGQDGPFATFEKALKTIREQRAKGVKETFEISIKGGDYLFDKSLFINPADSGTTENPLIIRACEGETVRFIGGKRIYKFDAAVDTSILNRIDKNVLPSIKVCDLNKLGIDPGKGFSSRGWRMGKIGHELFYNNAPLQIARYPNKGWIKIADVPQDTGTPANIGCDHTVRFGVPVGKHYGKFVYDGNKPSHWRTDKNIWMFGYWGWDWEDEYINVESIDTVKKYIYPSKPYHYYGFTKNQRYCFLNVPEELDTTGEYYIDRTKGILYLYPPDNDSKGEYFFSTLDTAIIILNNTANVIVKGIQFTYSAALPVVVEGGHHCVITDCIVSNIGGNGILINGGHYNGIKNCEVYNVDEGITVFGGNRKTLTYGYNYIENSDIHHYSRINSTYKVGIGLNGVGNRISHSHIHHAPHAGVIFLGNEMILEYNEIDNIALETGDVGGFYIGRDWTMRGNIIRYNYFHDLVGPGLYGVNAVYLDDFTSGTTIYGNLFYKTKMGTMVGGGRDNIIENNLYVNCSNAAVRVDSRGLGWAKNYFNGKINTLFDRMDSMNFSKPPYSVKYPILLTYYNDQPAVPKNNKFIRNVFFGDKFINLYDHADIRWVGINENVIATKYLCYAWDSIQKVDRNFDKNDKGVLDYLLSNNNKVMEENPGVIISPEGKISLKENSTAFSYGFKPIPFDSIGLFRDRFPYKK